MRYSESQGTYQARQPHRLSQPHEAHEAHEACQPHCPHRQQRLRPFRFTARLAIVVLLLALVVALPLTGCAKNDAKTALADICQALQEKDSATAETICSSVWFSSEDYGVPADTFTDCYFDGFTYELGKVKMEKSTSGEQLALVELTVSTHSSELVMETLAQAWREAQATGTTGVYGAGSAKGFFQDLYAEDPWPSEVTTITVPMEKDADSGVWQPVDYAALSASILGGIDPRQEMN